MALPTTEDRLEVLMAKIDEVKRDVESAHGVGNSVMSALQHHQEIDGLQFQVLKEGLAEIKAVREVARIEDREDRQAFATQMSASFRNIYRFLWTVTGAVILILISMVGFGIAAYVSSHP